MTDWICIQIQNKSWFIESRTCILAQSGSTAWLNPNPILIQNTGRYLPYIQVINLDPIQIQNTGRYLPTYVGTYVQVINCSRNLYEGKVPANVWNDYSGS